MNHADWQIHGQFIPIVGLVKAHPKKNAFHVSESKLLIRMIDML
jgi:hypothetical protein